VLIELEATFYSLRKNHVVLVTVFVALTCFQLFGCSSDSLEQPVAKAIAVGQQVVKGQGSESFSFTMEGPEKISGSFSSTDNLDVSVNLKFEGPSGAALNLVSLIMPGQEGGCALLSAPAQYLKLDEDGRAETKAELQFTEVGDCSLRYEMWGSTTFQEPIPDAFLLEGDIEKVQVAFAIPFQD
jgi:hypothetical protein